LTNVIPSRVEESFGAKSRGQSSKKALIIGLVEQENTHRGFFLDEVDEFVSIAA